jgi:hypothetical protein
MASTLAPGGSAGGSASAAGVLGILAIENLPFFAGDGGSAGLAASTGGGGGFVTTEIVNLLGAEAWEWGAAGRSTGNTSTLSALETARCCRTIVNFSRE